MKDQIIEIDIPPEARELTTLSRVDYTDAFILETARAADLTGEQWARAILEGAPEGTRTMLRRGWFMLGVRLGSTDDESLVLGWTVRRSFPDHALLAARSPFGLDAEVLFKREPKGLLAATLMKFNNPIARAFWGRFSSRHRKVLRHLLRQVADPSVGAQRPPHRPAGSVEDLPIAR